MKSFKSFTTENINPNQSLSSFASTEGDDLSNYRQFLLMKSFRKKLRPWEEDPRKYEPSLKEPVKVKPTPKVNEDLRDWFKEKWVRFDTKGNIKGDCAREPGEGKPKCRPLASARAMSQEARARAARRKRREDPVADRAGKGEKPIFVRTEEYIIEKNTPTNPALWSRAKSLAKSKFDVYPSAYANGWAAKWYKSKGGGWKGS